MYHDGPSRGLIAGRPEVLARFPQVGEELWQRAARVFPVQLTRSWLRRIGQAGDALGRQVLPTQAELEPDPRDRADPVGEQQRSPVPWVVQKHDDRVLLQLTRRCHLYCRYCFRRDLDGPADPSPAELERALEWIVAAAPREIILSGGDPLAARRQRLLDVIDAVRPAVPVVRIHTRAPITAPAVVSEDLVQALAARRPVWVVVHCNHPDELGSDVDQALARLVDAGIPVLNQAVLLAGVNDDARVLARLCQELVARRVFPYYLHHPDHVAGNAAFRLEPERGLDLVRQLQGLVSGLALPRYVIDPPDGLGKLDVSAWVAAGGQRPPVPSGAPPDPAESGPPFASSPAHHRS